MSKQSVVSVLVGVATGSVAIAAVFRLLTDVSRARNLVTPTQVADLIENHLEGRENSWDWDQFTSIPIANKALDQIRLRCIEIDTPTPITSEKREELKATIRQLRFNEIGSRKELDTYDASGNTKHP